MTIPGIPVASAMAWLLRRRPIQRHWRRGCAGTVSALGLSGEALAALIGIELALVVVH